MVALAIAGAALGAAREHVIRGDKSAGGILIGRSTPPQVRKLFGAPSAIQTAAMGKTCKENWKSARLVVEFFTFETNPCIKGVALVVTVTGRAAWRTTLGLRVGDPAARVRKLYPRAPLKTGIPGDNGYWLVTRKICAEVGGGQYAGLLARMKAGKVSALVARIAVCD